MSEKPRILIISSTGLIGGYLLREFKRKGYPTAGTFHSFKDQQSDYFIEIREKETIAEVFDRFCPDVVILNAAFSNVELCQSEQEFARAVNIVGSSNVVQFCKERDVKLVFFSSDYVFDGKAGPYSEEDEPNPINFYGLTKLEGEKIIRQNLKDYLIIRTTVVYGNEILGKNFALRIISLLSKNQKVTVPDDQVGSPTYALNLSEIIEELVKRKKIGIYNVVGRDVMSRYSFALELSSEFALNKDLIVPMKTKELKQAAERPLLAGLSIEKIRKEISLKILGVKESLKIFKEELNGQVK